MMAKEAWRGHVNRFTPPGEFAGWAVDFHDTDASLEVTVRLRGQPIGSGRAENFNADLTQFGSGNFAFVVACDIAVPFAAIYSGDVDVMIGKDGREYGVLRIDRALGLFAAMLEVARLTDEFAAFDARLLRNVLNNTLPYIPKSASTTIGSVLTLIQADRNLLPDTAASFDRNQISGLYFRAGIKSSDESTVVGRDGHLFLVEGSNRVLDLFSRPYGDAVSVEIADKWLTLIASRLSMITGLGAHFVQVVIPDKLSLTRELLDGTMSQPTATLAAFEERAVRELPASSYLSGLSVFAGLPFASAFRKVDTHLTPRGAFAIFSAILAMIGCKQTGAVIFDMPFTLSGDLSQRFFGHPLYEVCHAAREPSFAAGRELVFERHPPPGRYVGHHQIFRNAMAPIRKKAMVFGNSFFGGYLLQTSINYWMSVWFEEYHFMASPHMDAEYVRRENPAVVICQTIERFLEFIPQT